MKILFVCTGNTCRSPMALGLFQQILKREGRDEVFASSAGLSARGGDAAAENAVSVCREVGVDIGGHRARKITAEDLSAYDLFFVMSGTHAYILERAGAMPEKIYVPDQIFDPYGGDINVYRQCRDKISQELERFYQEIVAPAVKAGL